MNINTSIKNQNDITEFYNSSDLYLKICEERKDIDFKNVIDVVREYVPREASLLEFGCGTGNLAYLISKEGYKVLGVDISDRFINYASEKYKSNVLKLDFSAVGFGKLPYPDNSYDCIYTCAVLEHCYEIDKIILNFDRLLKPGGILIISTPNLISPFTRLSLIFSRLMGKRNRFHRFGTPTFFFKSIYYNIKKSFSVKKDFLYVNPIYKGFQEADEDVTYLSNHYDYIYLLSKLNFKILEVSRGTSRIGRIIAKIFPKLSGEVQIVAKK